MKIELFSALADMSKNWTTIKVQDCKAPGSMRPQCLLSSLFCFNNTNKYTIFVSFAKILEQAWQGQAVDWHVEFRAELKYEIITLHRQQVKGKVKVIKSPLGPHVTILLHVANALNEKEKRETWFMSSQSLTMLQQTPT